MRKGREEFPENCTKLLFRILRARISLNRTIVIVIKIRVTDNNKQ